MTDFPALGQKAPNVWRDQLKAYIDEADATSASAGVLSVAGRVGAVSLTTADIGGFTEAAQDAIASLLVSGANVTLTYNDVANTLQITAAGGDAEVMRDTIGAAIVGAGVISVVVNDAADTITITSVATQNSTDAQLRDRTTHTGIMPLAGVAAGSRLECPLNGTVSTDANLARPSTRTDIFFTWNSTVQPVNMIAGDKWDMPA